MTGPSQYFSVSISSNESYDAFETAANSRPHVDIQLSEIASVIL